MTLIHPYNNRTHNRDILNNFIQRISPAKYRSDLIITDPSDTKIVQTKDQLQQFSTVCNLQWEGSSQTSERLLRSPHAPLRRLPNPHNSIMQTFSPSPQLHRSNFRQLPILQTRYKFHRHGAPVRECGITRNHERGRCIVLKHTKQPTAHKGIMPRSRCIVSAPDRGAVRCPNSSTSDIDTVRPPTIQLDFWKPSIRWNFVSRMS